MITKKQADRGTWMIKCNSKTGTVHLWEKVSGYERAMESMCGIECLIDHLALELEGEPGTRRCKLCESMEEKVS